VLIDIPIKLLGHDRLKQVFFAVEMQIEACPAQPRLVGNVRDRTAEEAPFGTQFLRRIDQPPPRQAPLIGAGASSKTTALFTGNPPATLRDLDGGAELGTVRSSITVERISGYA